MLFRSVANRGSKSLFNASTRQFSSIGFRGNAHIEPAPRRDAAPLYPLTALLIPATMGWYYYRVLQHVEEHKKAH